MNTKKKRAVLLVNLGSPASPEPASIRKFLGQFLSDRRVVEIPALIWQPLLRCVILPLRSKRVAHLYRSIWTAEGSPLAAITIKQAALLQDSLHESGEKYTVVRYAMTYGHPSIEDVVGDLREQGFEKILLIPMYPQYSGTTTGAIYDQVADLYHKYRHVPDLHVVREYCYRNDYIRALAASVIDHRQAHGAADKLVFSFHGIPQACVEKGDPYFEQCKYTAQAVAECLGLSSAEWELCFQSRFGKAQWLQPYTDDVLQRLAQEGIRRVDIICPAFVADCLETLEEIEVGSRECFTRAGGEYFARIACLNDRKDHIRMLRSIVEEMDF
ncbi:MAG TPA: ferrochelatase [Pseudomonadales bacterium]|nr:ferrochelatase [Pseudomonadales bacterium]